MDLHFLRSSALRGMLDCTTSNSISGSSFLSKIQICISQWINASHGWSVGKHGSSGHFGSPQKWRSAMISGRNGVRNLSASWMNRLDILHNEETSWLNPGKPIEHGSCHMFRQMRAIINDHFERRGIVSFHFCCPYLVQKVQIAGISTMQSMGVEILLVLSILGGKVPPWPFAFGSRSFFNTRNLHTVSFGCWHEFLIGIVALSIEEANFQKLKRFCLRRRVRTQSFLIHGVVKVPPRTTCFLGAPLSCTTLWVFQAWFESHVALHLVSSGSLGNFRKSCAVLPRNPRNLPWRFPLGALGGGVVWNLHFLL